MFAPAFFRPEVLWRNECQSALGGKGLGAAPDPQHMRGVLHHSPRGADGVFDAFDAGNGPGRPAAPFIIKASSSHVPVLVNTAPLPALKMPESSSRTMAVTTASSAVPPCFRTW